MYMSGISGSLKLKALLPLFEEVVGFIGLLESFYQDLNQKEFDVNEQVLATCLKIQKNISVFFKDLSACLEDLTKSHDQLKRQAVDNRASEERLKQDLVLLDSKLGSILLEVENLQVEKTKIRFSKDHLVTKRTCLLREIDDEEEKILGDALYDRNLNSFSLDSPVEMSRISLILEEVEKCEIGLFEVEEREEAIKEEMVLLESRFLELEEFREALRKEINLKGFKKEEVKQRIDKLAQVIFSLEEIETASSSMSKKYRFLKEETVNLNDSTNWVLHRDEINSFKNEWVLNREKYIEIIPVFA